MNITNDLLLQAELDYREAKARRNWVVRRRGRRGRSAESVRRTRSSADLG